jgi:hypothetical protein
MMSRADQNRNGLERTDFRAIRGGDGSARADDANGVVREGRGPTVVKSRRKRKELRRMLKEYRKRAEMAAQQAYSAMMDVRLHDILTNLAGTDKLFRWHFRWFYSSLCRQFPRHIRRPFLPVYFGFLIRLVRRANINFEALNLDSREILHIIGSTYLSNLPFLRYE